MLSRRKFLYGLAAAGFGGAAFDLRRNDTPFPKACAVRPVPVAAPAGWAGKTALFLSDIHFGNFFGPAETAALNHLVGQHAPDVVLMGGDFAHTPTTPLGEFMAHWSPGCPTFFVPGNHDLTHSAGSPVMQQAREGGMRVLCNEAETWNGLTFVGLPSALCLPQRRSLLETSGLKIVLAHEPDTWDRYPQPDLLQLAGHTHGGQVRLAGHPIFLPPLGQKYPLGDFSRGATRRLIVSAGLGCTTVHARINCPPEIVKLVFT
jgi:hypothetical protein